MTTPTPLPSHPAVAEFLALDDERVKGDWDKLTSQATYFAKLTPWLIVASKIAPEVRRLVERCAELECENAERIQMCDDYLGRLAQSNEERDDAELLVAHRDAHIDRNEETMCKLRAELTALRKERGDLRGALEAADRWILRHDQHRLPDWACEQCVGVGNTLPNTSPPTFVCTYHQAKARTEALAAYDARGAQGDELVKFLCGEGPLDGVWFGESHPTERGDYWWRKYVRVRLPKESE